MAQRKIPPSKTPPQEMAPGRLRIVHELLLSSQPVENRLRSPAELAHWLHSHGLNLDEAAVDEAAWRDALQLRDDLLALVRVRHGEPCPGEVLQRLNEAPDVRHRVHIQADATLRETVVLPTGWAGVRFHLLEIVRAAVREGEWSRFRYCDSEHCHWLFYDTSTNRLGRWCRRQCGNREAQRKRRQR